MTQVANTYAQALYSLAREEGLQKQILDEIAVLSQAFSQEPEFLRLLGSANLSKAERCAILEECFAGKITPYLLNFMKLLTEKGYIRYFPDCCKAYEQQYNVDNDILPVRAVSAVPLSPMQQDKLIRKLSGITGKTIQLTNRVDAGILGGVRLDYDGKRVDGTVKNRLDAIGHLLKNTVL